MTRPGPGLVSRSGRQGAAIVGLALLDEARAAVGRLENPDDDEALHDFRVAIRRVRTLLRSFRPELKAAVPRKLERRLRTLTRHTGAGRDAEVQLTWLGEHRPALGARARPGVNWFTARLTERRDRAYATIREGVAPEFRELERRMRRALTTAKIGTGVTQRAPFGVAAARVLQAELGALEQELAAARARRDEEAVHGGRIAVKRLRYLLESLSGDVNRASALIGELKALQELLGQLHDLHVLIAELGEAVADAAAERARRLHTRALGSVGGTGSGAGTRSTPRRPAPGSAGLLALARLAAANERELYQRLLGATVDAQVQAVVSSLTALATELAPEPPTSPVRSPRPLRTRYTSRARP
ncbi:MAG TPA: CHAD domain-containing protein [Gemmatimonadales bacterium]|nr:CHAD domain-containing protein [Gemmatimonadales bacterium]